MTAIRIEEYRERVASVLQSSGIVLTQAEKHSMEFADFGLGRFEMEGLAIVVYENNDRYCAKELVMLPHQTCSEHRHPPVGTDPGKRETFRCRAGLVWLYVEGSRSETIRATVPQTSRAHYTVFHEIELRPGTQYTIEPNTLHWFQSGDDGAIVSEFSSTSHDESDIFTDPNIRRVA